nr:CHASE sensor domain-containing protein [Methylomarinum sp. Ch1-1]MDP4522280.1 CHASE sensor domain-containing protein [Methylomarinum sp. Ch1-1]
MNKHFRKLSIKWKLLSILTFSSILSLFLALLLLVFVEVTELKSKVRSDLTAMGSLVANRSTAALSFDDKAVARENLTALKEMNEVTAACLYDQQGRIFTSLYQGRNQGCPTTDNGLSTHSRTDVAGYI